MSQTATVVGIDLGTTNSEVAAFRGKQVEILGPGREAMLPSCVGLSPAGGVVVGEMARNQLLLYPERTVRSIKRKMGGAEKVSLGEQTFTPQEISALILRELVGWAKTDLGQPVEKAVITVPAYFSDAQRQATREAGALAGLEVLRILNEPTAASLAYGCGQSQAETSLIYDLGGGTFDVSIVTVEGDVTEVLASHGNNHLGGDDFDQLILDWLLEQFKSQHAVDLSQEHPKAYARLRWAAEEAKKNLSFEPYSRIREEALVTLKKGKSLHLDVELSREAFEQMIRPSVESTFSNLSKALEGARLGPSQLDAVLLVGGSTRIPLVSRLLNERIGLNPRRDLNPDLCVALGAGVLASRLAGREVGRVLVDVSPYSFGPSYLGLRDGYPYPHLYKAIIEKNSPLPVTRTESYTTSVPFQKEVKLEIFQGEEQDALKNIPVGEFLVGGLQPKEGPNEVLCRMSLDIDGILQITAIEKATGLSKQVSIDGALRRMSEEEVEAARSRLQALHDPHYEADQEIENEDIALPDHANPLYREALTLVVRAQRAADRMHADDIAEAQEIQSRIASALDAGDEASLLESANNLRELLFFVESARS